MLRKSYRSEWIEMQRQNPGVGRNKLSMINRKTYRWLILNDKEWFEKNSPARQIIKKKANRINWAERDLELAVRADLMAKEFLASPHSPVRVSITGIADRLKIAYLVVKRPDCIPKTIKILQKNAESTEEFIARRILYAANCFIREHKSAPFWKVLTRAKVSSPKLVKLPKVQLALKKAMKKLQTAESLGWKDSELL